MVGNKSLARGGDNHTYQFDGSPAMGRKQTSDLTADPAYRQKTHKGQYKDKALQFRVTATPTEGMGADIQSVQKPYQQTKDSQETIQGKQLQFNVTAALANELRARIRSDTTMSRRWPQTGLLIVQRLHLAHNRQCGLLQLTGLKATCLHTTLGYIQHTKETLLVHLVW